MSRTVYVNGSYVPEADAKVSIFDRAFLMADGVYEVTTVLDGKLIDFEGHMIRLERSLNELSMRHPCDRSALLDIHRSLVEKNDIDEGLVYLQVTRGSAGDRDFAYPDDTVEPGLVLFTQSKPGLSAPAAAARGMSVISIEDWRWARRDIKTVQLLYPSMAKMAANAQGADDAWMIQDGHITEGTSNNAYIIKDGVIVTRPTSTDILHGITRAAVLRFAQAHQMRVEERLFTLDEAKAADEAFVTSASAFVMPVVSIDGAPVGTGQSGPMALQLREIYIDEMRKAAI